MKTAYKLGLIGAGILTTGLLVAGNASATDNTGGFGFQRMLANKAEVLNMSEEELRNQLGQKTFTEIAEDQGISQEEMHEAMKARSRAKWEEMGIPQDEIEARIQAREERHLDCDGSGPLMKGQNSGGNRGFGHRLAQ
ncbi:MAG: hypothetical protein WBD86_00560 [Microgenomates group bacterium]